MLINEFQKGIAPSSYLGFEFMRCCDIRSRVGAIRPNFASAEETDNGSIVDLMEQMVIDDDGVIYGYTTATQNKIYQRATDGTWSVLAGNQDQAIGGIAWWEGHLIVIYLNSDLDAWDKDNTTWHTDFDTITSTGATHNPTIVGQDGILYIGNSRFVEALSLVDGAVFDPSGAVGTDWALSLEAAVLSQDYQIVSIVALGKDLMLGTKNKEHPMRADIFPWGRDVQEARQPIRIQENDVRMMITVNNLVYVMAGKRGHWYVTNGSTVSFVAKIPETVIPFVEERDTITVYRDAVAYNDGLIYFGIGNNDATFSNLGIYSLDPVTGVINMEHIISTGEDGSNDQLQIGSIIAEGGFDLDLIWSWQDDENSSYGADHIGASRYTGDTAYFITRFLLQGTAYTPASIDQPSYRLARALTTGDSIKVWYRKEQGAAWTTFASPHYYYEATVGVINGQMPSITNIEGGIQFKVALNADIELIDIPLI